MDKQNLEYVALVYQLHVQGRGRRDAFSTDPDNGSTEWCSSIVVDGEVVKLHRQDAEIWVPVSAVKEMRPVGGKIAPKPAPKPEPKPERVAVVVPVPMPADEVTPADEPRKRGRPRKNG